MLSRRLLTALVGVLILLGIIGLGGLTSFTVFVLAVTTLALSEYFRMAFPGRLRIHMVGMVAGMLLFLIVILPQLPERGLLLALLLAGIFATFVFMGGELEERYRDLGFLVLGTLYVAYLFPHYVLLYQAGKQWVFWVLLVVFLGDTAAYFVGMALGRRKLYPAVSPGKTWIGAVAFLVASGFSGVFASGPLGLGLSFPAALSLSVVVGVTAQVGDLFESWIKRVFAVKDSGGFLPGHGGVLDRLDSLIFPGVVTTVWVRLIHS